jgi:hypothetical protein
MDKKIFAVLLLFLALISIASVSAVNLTSEHNFENLFSVNVVDGDNFTQIGEPNAYSTLLNAKLAYKNNNDSVFVLMYDDIGYALDYLLPASDDYDKDGDLLIFNASAIEGEIDASSKMYKIDGLKDKITCFAGKYIDSDTYPYAVFIAGNDTDLVKEYAETIKFNDTFVDK